MTRLTIRWRVTLIAVGVLFSALVLLGAVGNILLTSRLKADAESVLRSRAAAQAATLERVGGKVQVREAAADAALDNRSWVFADNHWVEQSRAPADVQAAVNELARSGTPGFRSVGESVRLYARPVRSDQGESLGIVIVGLSLNAYERNERITRLGTSLFALFVLLAAAAAIYWAVGRALEPVDAMTRRASDWSEHDLHRRFELGEPHDEIGALAATLDTLLERIDAAMQREQRVTAEIAHELRTPLASVRAEAELGLLDSDGNSRETLDRIVASADRMNAAIETLLAAHRGDAPVGRSCDPALAARSAVDAFREARLDRDWRVAAELGDALVEVDEAVLIQTLGPLLDNAARHAEHAVQVDVNRDQQKVVIAVADDGPGFQAGAERDIFAAGVSDGARAGLGLPLARRLAQSFGAELVAVPGAPGGRFELRMPGRKPS
jgi:two-component system OmpR family sensor kinase